MYLETSEIFTPKHWCNVIIIIVCILLYLKERKYIILCGALLCVQQLGGDDRFVLIIK